MTRIKLATNDNQYPLVAEIPEDPPSYLDRPAEAKLWAKHAWLNRVASSSQIADSILCNPVTVNGWIVKWKQEIVQVESKALASSVRKFSKRLEVVFDKMLTVYERSAEKMLEQNVLLGLGDMKGFSSSLESVFKMRQLETGQPTEIHATDRPATWADVLNKLKEVDIVEYDGEKTVVSKLTEVIPEAKEAWKTKSA